MATNSRKISTIPFSARAKKTTNHGFNSSDLCLRCLPAAFTVINNYVEENNTMYANPPSPATKRKRTEKDTKPKKKRKSSFGEGKNR